MKESRSRNGIKKKAENVRRDKRMLALLKKGQVPYVPSIMSWLSVKLDKPSSRISQADVDTLLKG